MHPYSQNRQRVSEALDYLREVMPEGGVVFTGVQTSMLLRRYFCPDRTGPARTRIDGYWEVECEGYLLVECLRWTLDESNLGTEFFTMSERYGLEPGTRVCVPFVGWGRTLSRKLADAGFSSPDARDFGGNISVQTIAVGELSLPESLEQRVSSTQAMLHELAQAVETPELLGLRAVVWPGRYLDARARSLTRTVADTSLTFEQFYRPGKLDIRKLKEHLPVLVIWIVDNKESHPKFMTYMNRGKPYLAGGFSFVPLATDAGGRFIAYRMRVDPDGDFRPDRGQ
jgi:hypothetical protein